MNLEIYIKVYMYATCELCYTVQALLSSSLQNHCGQLNQGGVLPYLCGYIQQSI